MRRIAAVTAALAVLPGCAHSGTPADAVNATLQNVDDSALRESIRLFVREHAGRGVIARPDSLATQSQLELTARLRTDGMETAQVLQAVPSFRLKRDNTGMCWIVREADGGSEAMSKRLPATAICRVETEDS